MVYQVQVALDVEFTDLVVNTIVENTTDHEIVKDLEPFTVYHWRVKAINQMTGAQSDWSVPCVFRVKATDVVINHSIDEPTTDYSYVWYGTEVFGLEHKFVRSYDTECITPDAVIGFGVCGSEGDAVIGVGDCPGVCVPEFDGFELEYIFTENNELLYTEDGVMLALEF